MIQQTQELDLNEAVTHLLEECRMVLPGIQALFGFQLVAVFNQAFEKLTRIEQTVHLAALVLVAMSVALVMTPAAYHRQTGQRMVTQHLLTITTRLLLWSMFPLMLGICIDVDLIERLIIGNAFISALIALLLFCFFFSLWFLWPRWNKLRNGQQ